MISLDMKEEIVSQMNLVSTWDYRFTIPIQRSTSVDLKVSA